jgi:hypothetical protein
MLPIHGVAKAYEQKAEGNKNNYRLEGGREFLEQIIQTV